MGKETILLPSDSQHSFHSHNLLLIKDRDLVSACTIPIFTNVTWYETEKKWWLTPRLEFSSSPEMSRTVSTKIQFLLFW